MWVDRLDPADQPELVIVPFANVIQDRLGMEIMRGCTQGCRFCQAGYWYPPVREHDPQVVMDILVGVANDHPDVLSDPEPAALFLGFGDSSLDFQLRAWTRTDYVRVSSDLLVAMNNALVDAGIEIPFPQHDLHLRSVDIDAAEVLPGRVQKDHENPPD